MTKKHFKKVASIVKQIKPKKQRLYIAIEFVIYFEEMSKRFDREKFFEACEV